jgi:hypothetical protein
MNKAIDKKMVKRFLEQKGQARGIHFRNDAEFVLKKKGEKGLKDLETELKKLGCPIDYLKINNLGFYPIGWRPISLLAMEKVFGWKDKEIRELCAYAAGVSLIVKLYMKFFYSLDKMVEKAPEIWKEYFTEGELKVVDYDEQKRYTIIRVENFNLDPVFCRCLEGYFENIIKMVIRTDKVNCQETRCAFDQHDYHEFLIKW